MKTVVALSAMILCAAHAQTGIGKFYGSRDPHVCASRKSPNQGALSAEQAKQYFTCGVEGESHTSLILISDLKMEVAKGRPFNIRTDSMTKIDPAQPVYDVRGSFIYYQCSRLGDVNGQAGKNCIARDEPKAEGICYKDTFGDWNCFMTDAAAVANFRAKRTGQPPPR